MDKEIARKIVQMMPNEVVDYLVEKNDFDTTMIAVKEKQNIERRIQDGIKAQEEAAANGIDVSSLIGEVEEVIK